MLVDAPRPTPAIGLLLVVGESLQVASVTVATPADSVLPRAGLPVAPADVTLRVEDDSGNTWTLVPTPTPGRFEAALSPVLGRRYRLLGTVLGRTVSHATMVPERFDLLSLPGDTITAADAVPCAFSFGNQLCFVVDTDSDQLLTVLCRVRAEPAPSVCSIADGGQLRLTRGPAASDVFIVGYNGDALRPRLDATITEFGAAVAIRRTAIIP